MPERSSKSKPKAKKADLKPKKARLVNPMARAVMARIEQIAEEHPQKNPAAVMLGRQGGLKGGRARMDSMTAAERRKLALKAARARWGN